MIDPSINQSTIRENPSMGVTCSRPTPSHPENQRPEAGVRRQVKKVKLFITSHRTEQSNRTSCFSLTSHSDRAKFFPSHIRKLKQIQVIFAVGFTFHRFFISLVLINFQLYDRFDVCDARLNCFLSISIYSWTNCIILHVQISRVTVNTSRVKQL